MANDGNGTKDSAGARDEARPSGPIVPNPPDSLAQRIREAHAARCAGADADYTDQLAAGLRSGALDRGGIFLDTVRRFTLGTEPTWLVRAKRLHEALAKDIYILSRATTVGLPAEVLAAAEARVREFVESMPAEGEQRRLDKMTLIVVIELVCGRHESVAPMLDAGQRPAEVVCFTYSMHDLDLAVQLAPHVDDIALLLSRWDDDTPRTPSKWDLIAALWEKATGELVSRETWRRYDPSRKQVAPGARRKST
jgi:hypothetical protein